MQYGRVFGSRTGYLNPERGFLKPIIGPPCTTAQQRVLQHGRATYFHIGDSPSPEGPAAQKEVSSYTYNREPFIMEWSLGFRSGVPRAPTGTLQPRRKDIWRFRVPKPEPCSVEAWLEKPWWTGRDLPLRAPLIPSPGWDPGGPNI